MFYTGPSFNKRKLMSVMENLQNYVFTHTACVLLCFRCSSVRWAAPAVARCLRPNSSASVLCGWSAFSLGQLSVL